MPTELVVLLVGLAFVLSGGWFTVRGFTIARRADEFRARALVATAVVLELRESWLRHHERPDTKVFRPVVRFALPDGRSVDTATMSARNPPPAQVGQVVEIQYDPADPTRADLVHGSALGRVSCVTVGLGIGFVLIGVVALAAWYVVTQVFP